MNPPLYIFDLDGTLADTEHRLHFIAGGFKDWEGFFAACAQDTPIHPVIGVLNALQQNGAEVWIWTGRSATVRPDTVGWLMENDITPASLTMRGANDRRPDDVLKAEWLSALNARDRARLVATFEDRDRVVEMWRREGVHCFQVAPGKF